MTRAVLRLHVGPDVIRAEAVQRHVTVWAGEAPYAQPDGLSEAIAGLAAAASVPVRRVTVLVAPPLLQLRTIAGLPPVRPAKLASLVAHQAGRFFRKNGVPLVTDAAWVSQGGAPLARAAAVAEPVVEAIVTGVRAAGLVLDTIRAEGDGPYLELLPSAERATRQHCARRGVRHLLSVAAALLLVAGLVSAARLGAARRHVDARLAALQPPLAAVLAARRELRVAEATVRAARGTTAAHGHALALLAELARSLPDSAVITSLTLRGDGSGVLSGLAWRASTVLAGLEAVPRFASARLQGPVSREAVGGREWERFTVEWP